MIVEAVLMKPIRNESGAVRGAVWGCKLREEEFEKRKRGRFKRGVEMAWSNLER